MTLDLDSIASLRGGYILRPDLLDLGYKDRHIRQALDAGTLVRLRVGTYAPQSHQKLRAEEKYRLLCFAVLDKLPSGVVLSHQSAAAIHTGVTWGFDLETVHVTRLDGRSQRPESGVIHHAGALSESDVARVEGRPVVVPARAALEAASMAGTEAGMIQTSLVLRAGVDAGELHERLEAMRRWPGFNAVRLSVLWAAPACESVGEIRSVCMFRRGNLPIPRMQVTFFSADGREIARVDFDWEDFHHCGEFDGLEKYGRLNPHAASMPGQVLVDEKLREDSVRELSRGMSRWIWRDLHTPTATCRRIAAAMEQSRRRYGPPPRTIIV
ncbi:type IV toxin-antitoxin system AbiEi family antitoxin domain-containing protein [Aeromicrobium choanae]|uniref:Transcriptional regulator, AbiEi antitoxin, Type IV TA system n=1 Tax=Aeromicrobium choanae TaxID=1736691 RepID=A0A1T4YNC0_9ACTN|nr:type IV toxin-antitoxin system AbiEi family antitoxin domain-containing protein [Aeromicrobium choanae]SKB03334.1 Transcriptional regulator, AbiEi antitoxin, Type IV TA system [Aeromicrobium choanae]